MVLHVILLHCMVFHGIVLYSFFCRVSHCFVPLLQRAGELLRSASSHFLKKNTKILLTLLITNKPSTDATIATWEQY